MNSKVKTISLVVFLYFCAALVSVNAQSRNRNEDKSGVEVAFPIVEGWERGDIYAYPTAELGYSIAYQAKDGASVTVYVYNGGNKTISNDINDKIVSGQMVQAKNDIKKVGELGYYQNVEEIKSETITLGGSAGKIKSHYVLFNYKIREQPVISEICLFSYKNNFIKIRITRPDDDSASEHAGVKYLLSEIDKLFSK